MRIQLRPGIREPEWVDNLLLDVLVVRPASHAFDHQTKQRVANVAVLEGRIGRQNGVFGRQRAQLRHIRKRLLDTPEISLDSIANDAAHVVEQLADRRVGREPRDVRRGGVVESQSATFDQLHDRRGGERLRVRRDAEYVPRGHWHGRVKLGEAIRFRQRQLVGVAHGNHQAWDVSKLAAKSDPSIDVGERIP